MGPHKCSNINVYVYVLNCLSSVFSENLRNTLCIREENFRFRLFVENFLTSSTVAFEISTLSNEGSARVIKSNIVPIGEKKSRNSTVTIISIFLFQLFKKNVRK